MLATYVHDDESRKFYRGYWPEFADTEVIITDLVPKGIAYIDNSIVMQDKLRKAGREDLVRPLNEPSS
jgi:hypothetical protein